ncbi:DNA-binding transcriptional activator GcvA [Burkholderia pseudomallei]|nr:DNA-binding transcriptional activator GcvA [Burkholderia pseudomallei]
MRLFDIAGPSPWHYFFVCPPSLAQTPRVQALRSWLLDEIARFRALCAAQEAQHTAAYAAARARGKEEN